MYLTRAESASVSSPRKRQRSNPKVDFSDAQHNLVAHGQGIIKPPFPQSPTFPPSVPKNGLPQLPPRHLAVTLMQKYLVSIHTALPILHWQSFTYQYENVYRKGSFQFVPQAWTALFFALLACGSLYDNHGNGQSFLEVSQSLMDVWTDSLTLDHVASTMLISLYSFETNRRSVGWTMLGYAVRAAQDLGLHRENTSIFIEDEDKRRRVWWSIYVFDR